MPADFLGSKESYFTQYFTHFYFYNRRQEEEQKVNPSSSINQPAQQYITRTKADQESTNKRQKCPSPNPPNPTANPAPSATNPETSWCAAKSTNPSPFLHLQITLHPTTTNPLSNPEPGTSFVPAPAGSA
jgi:hypothetical protein